VVGHCERIAVVPITHLELALEVRWPAALWCHIAGDGKAIE